MTRRLSDKFHGDKKFTNQHYVSLQKDHSLPPQTVAAIFSPYTEKLQGIVHGGANLFDLFNEFIQLALRNFMGLPFPKLSTLIEILGHVFQHSFEKWLTPEESHNYFTEVVVRHCLFRPPHGVNVFTYEDLTCFTEWWINNFYDYYQEYQACFKSKLNRVLCCKLLPGHAAGDLGLTVGKKVELGEVKQILGLK